MTPPNAPLEQGELAAFRDFYSAAPDAIRDSLQIETHDVSGATAFFVGNSRVLALNRVVGLGTFQPLQAADLDRILGHFQASLAGRLFLQLHPGAVTSRVRDWLGERGFVHYNNWYKLYHRLIRIPEAKSDLRIEEVGPGYATEFGSIVAAAFEWPVESIGWIGALLGRPSWRHFMAFDDTVPVATAALMITGKEAWLDFAVTVPSHRGRGAQKALIATRLQAARDLGCIRAQVETAEPHPDRRAVSLSNVRKMGFDVAYRRANYILEK